MSFASANYTSIDSTKLRSKIFSQIPENSKKQNRRFCHTQAAIHKAFTLYLQQETKEKWILFLGHEDPLEGSVATHSSILAWRISWTEEPGGLPSTGSQRVRHDWTCSHAAQGHTAGNQSLCVGTVGEKEGFKTRSNSTIPHRCKWSQSLTCVQFFGTPWTVAYQAPPSMGFSRQEYWSGLPLPSPDYRDICRQSGISAF